MGTKIGTLMLPPTRTPKAKLFPISFGVGTSPDDHDVMFCYATLTDPSSKLYWILVAKLSCLWLEIMIQPRGSSFLEFSALRGYHLTLLYDLLFTDPSSKLYLILVAKLSCL